MKITFIEHSGFMVELERSVLLFDYFQGDIPEVAREKDLYVFASHEHHDHYNPLIWDLRKRKNNTFFIISNDIHTKEDAIVLKPYEEKKIGQIQVETLKSNDQGLAFLVKVEGKTIYHAGDLNWWHWNGESEEDNIFYEKTFKEEMNRIKGRDIDVAFMLLDPRQEDKYCKGINYFLEVTNTKTVFPMHAFGKYGISKHYLNCDDGRKWKGIVQEITGPGEEFNI